MSDSSASAPFALKGVHHRASSDSSLEAPVLSSHQFDSEIIGSNNPDPDVVVDLSKDEEIYSNDQEFVNINSGIQDSSIDSPHFEYINQSSADIDRDTQNQLGLDIQDSTLSLDLGVN